MNKHIASCVNLNSTYCQFKLFFNINNLHKRQFHFLWSDLQRLISFRISHDPKSEYLQIRVWEFQSLGALFFISTFCQNKVYSNKQLLSIEKADIFFQFIVKFIFTLSTYLYYSIAILKTLSVCICDGSDTCPIPFVNI